MLHPFRITPERTPLKPDHLVRGPVCFKQIMFFSLVMNYTVKSQKITGYFDNSRIKICNIFTQSVCIFHVTVHTVKTNRITFTSKIFGPGVTKTNGSNYK